MINFESMANNIGETLKPHAKRLGEIVESYALRILCRLDDIAENTASGEFTEDRARPIAVTNGSDVFELYRVPSGTEVEVEWIAISDATNSTDLRGYLTVNGTMVFPFTMNSVGIGLILHPNDELGVYGPADARVIAQVKIRRHKPRNSAPGSGHRRQYPELEPDESTPRHAPVGTVNGR